MDWWAIHTEPELHIITLHLDPVIAVVTYCALKIVALVMDLGFLYLSVSGIELHQTRAEKKQWKLRDQNRRVNDSDNGVCVAIFRQGLRLINYHIFWTPVTSVEVGRVEFHCVGSVCNKSRGQVGTNKYNQQKNAFPSLKVWIRFRPKLDTRGATNAERLCLNSVSYD